MHIAMQDAFEVFVSLRYPFKIFNAHPQGCTWDLDDTKSDGLRYSQVGGDPNHSLIAHSGNFDGLSIFHLRHQGNHTREREIHGGDGILSVVQNIFHGERDHLRSCEKAVSADPW